ncbi:Protein of unknown function DUF3570 [Colwellia psychrerythraea]|uniref:DUF3570 domain-containing protein n=1 Tax=Colwellia psychrerythraea TaxID=28229 RepID=A0A099KYV7_COLPS|nr:Protein of unknown function DUF3570 [Colwellia psychrerythraea]
MLRVLAGADVAVISIRSVLFSFVIALLVICITSEESQAAVLQPDRIDVLYHSYDGGGMKIDGPAILLRKKTSETFAVSAYYYVDSISSASVDVMSTASPYTEKRKEAQLGLEYLHEKTLMDISVRQSAESDYLAKSINLNISQDTFGDLTNLSLGLAYSDNEVKRNGDEFFNEQSQQYRLRAGISQILTRNLSMNLNFEAVADEGYLNNPYRSVRYIDNTQPSGVGYQSEVYPNTRNSFASKISASYYLPYRAALFVHYRYFSDSWQIDATDVEVSYRHPIADVFEIELKVRHYQQTQASFYSDLFAYQDAQNYLARDKELSEFDDLTVGVGFTYFVPQKYSFGDLRSEASLQWDYIKFDYKNFRDPTAGDVVGTEPLYGFSANVIRIFYSLYF